MNRITLSSLVFVSLVAGQTVTNFTINVTGPTNPLRFPILNSVGSSHFSLSLRSDYRTHLAMTQNDIKFNYIRGHGILDDDVSTYLGGGINMYNVFNTFDYYLSINILPIVEIGFMPADLALNASETVFHYKGITSPPASYAQWYTYIYDFTSALVDRYGIETVRSFKFEVWNEPNCGFWSANQTEYFRLYNTTSRAVKAVDSFLRVGGPATAQLAWLEPFLEYVKNNSVPIDFISTHCYPTDTFFNQSDRDGFMKAIANAANTAQTAGLPLTITEFSAGLGTPANDGTYAASAILHYHLYSQNIPNLDTMSFWTFTDVFEEGGMISLPYTPAPKYGMITLYNVPKPVYRGFQFIARQPANALPVTGTGIDKHGQPLSLTTHSGGVSVGSVDAMVSSTTDGKTTTLVTILNNFEYYGEPINNSTVTVVFQNIPTNALVPSTASIEYIDSTHAYAKAVWEASGSPTYPSPVEVANESAASQLVSETIPLIDLGTNQGYAVTVNLEAYAVARLTIEYVL